MRKILIALGIVVGLTGTRALYAQHPMTDSARAGHHMAMMMEHHNVATIDLLVAHRDSLQLTDVQLKKLAELREHFGHATAHTMSGMGMQPGMAMQGGMAMEHGMGMGQKRAPVSFDRVPGKSVPRIRPKPAPAHDPMCPMASLTPAQRQQAHQLLKHGQHD